MAKIKITESELRQLIGESVVSILNEELGEGRAERYKKRYDAYNTAAQNYNANYAKEWNALGADEQQKWQDELNKMRSNPDSAEYLSDATPESIYNSSRNSAKAAMNAALNRRGVGAEMKKQLDIANQSLTNIYNQLGAKDHTTAMGNIQSLQSYNSAYKNAIATIQSALTGTLKESTTHTGPFQEPAQPGTPQAQIPELQNILVAIKNLKGQIAKLNATNQQLTSANKNLTSQNQNLTKRIQNGQSQRIASPIAAPKATAQATTQQTGLARPKVAAPGNAQA